MTLASTPSKPVTYIGFPLKSWLFALRVWVTMVAALYAAFWLQLESASSAAVCVGILSLPTRGQALQKAGYRMLATVIGVAASIVITGLFSQARDLYVVAFAAWLALCVYVAGFLDGNRAYGAVLSGYTVAVVAVMQIGTPQQVFLAGVNRGAAIGIGIAAVALINDIFAAPGVADALQSKLAAARRQTRTLILAMLRDGRLDPGETARVLKGITALHPEITALSGETVIRGSTRGRAARGAAAALVNGIEAARTLVGDRSADAAVAREKLVAVLAGDADTGPTHAIFLRRQADAGTPAEALPARHAADILAQDSLARDGLVALDEGTEPARHVRLPVFRSWRAAARNGIRVFLAVSLGAIPFVLSGWPEASLAFALLGVTAALSATTPSPRAFAQGALIAMPLAAVTAGVVEFLVLDGADQFQLLALAMAPPVFVGVLLLSSPKPSLSGIGFLLLVFFPVLLAPANPQSYDPETYLFSSTLSVTAVIALFICLAVILPTSDALRRGWLLRSAHDELAIAAAGRWRRRRHAQPSFRDADRIGQFMALRPDDVAMPIDDIATMLRIGDVTAAVRRAWTTLNGREHTGVSDEARAALAGLDPSRLTASAARLWASGDREAATALLGAARMIDATPSRDARPIEVDNR